MTEETLQQNVEGVITPNLLIREEDEELFEFNYVEYIRRDVEGSDSDTTSLGVEILHGAQSLFSC